METKTYWVGDRPGGSWQFTVLNQHTGQPYNLGQFTSAKTVMLDSDNREVTFPDANTTIADFNGGVVVFTWPDKSVFTKPGRYVLQLQFDGNGATRRTTVQEILVRKLGGVSK